MCKYCVQLSKCDDPMEIINLYNEFRYYFVDINNDVLESTLIEWYKNHKIFFDKFVMDEKYEIDTYYNIQAIHKASYNGHTYILKKILNVYKRNHKSVDDEYGMYGYTSLYSATRSKHIKCVHLLLQYGADPNKCSYTLLVPSPLHHAVLKENTECVQLLLKYGANPLIENLIKLTAFDIAINYGFINSIKLILNTVMYG